MAAPGRLAALPGYDTAPDVYETPDLTDDTSTTQRPTSSEDAEEEEGSDSTSASNTDSEDNSSNSESESGVVSRRRLKPSHARERFTREGKGVEVKGGRFGDRVGGLGGRGYRVGAVSRREGVEGLGERVARLRREVEECRVLAEREGKGEGVIGEGEMEGLKRVLEGLETGKERRVLQENGVESYKVGEETSKGVAEFDARLSVLEKSLGLSSLDAGAPEAPLLPSLALLDRQFGALMTASSITSLEAASGRIKKLKEEADQLSAATTDSPVKSPQQNGTSTPDSEHAQSGLAASDVEKLRSLHTLLPTLQHLSPTVPALLDRLRSLHTLHVGAANAASELEDLERRQDDFEKELTEWREGLDRVEKAVREADDTNGRNGKVVRGWVEGIEGKMSALG
jgi:nuclear migration protein JNM1